MRNAIIALAGLGLTLGHAGRGLADAITFESGYADRMAVTTPIVTATNSVRIGVATGGVLRSPSIARVGPPETAFTPDDRPANLARSGVYFLTDETNGPAGTPRDYRLAFAQPADNLSLDVYDYRGKDGGGKIGDTVTLSAFGDAAGANLVGSETYKITDPDLPNGAVEMLSIANPTAPILSANLSFSRGDIGTGIDNITFKTTAVPEPAALATLACGVLGLIAMRWHRR